MSTCETGEFTFTKFKSFNCKLNKSITLKDDKVDKTPSGNMARGKFTTHSTNVDGLYAAIDELGADEAIGVNICNKGESGKITASRNAKNGAIRRTSENFGFSNVLFIDIDDSGLKIDEVRPALCELSPEFSDATMLVLESSSSGVHIEGEEAKADSGSYHVYVSIMDGEDVPCCGEVLGKRCWLTGSGRIIVSASGSLLVRQLIDTAVYTSERLIFEARPTIGKGLVQDDRNVRIYHGGVLDTSRILSLSVEEEIQYQALVAEAKLKAKPEFKLKKKTYIDKEVVKLVDFGVDKDVARQQITISLESRELYSHQLLQFQEHGVVTVAEVLAAPKKFDECSLADPFEPEYHDNDTSVAKFYADKLVVHSFAHGRNNYYLKEIPQEPATKESLQKKVTAAIDNKKLHTGNLAQWIVDSTPELDAVGEEVLLEIVMKSLGMGRVKTSLKKAVSTIKLAKQKEKEKSFRAIPRKVQYDLSQPLDKMVFPDSSASGLLATKGNLVVMLKGYGIELHYDVIAKKQYLGVGEGLFCDDLADNAKLAEIDSLCGLNNLPFKCTDYLSPLFAVNDVNPVTDYIKDIKWDGKDHITALQNMVGVTSDSKSLWDIAFRRWLIQGVAAADGAKSTPNKEAKAKYEHCLVLAGKQGVNKTTFLGNLIPTKLKQYFADGVHLDPANKDSVKLAITNWIAELGEIDATFQRGDIARIKGFMSKSMDAMRLPYDRVESQFQRRTSFCGSVNDSQFLTDKTGSRRYWVVETLSLPTLTEIERKVDVDQLWAQAWELYTSGEAWWPDDEMKALVDASGERHATDNAVLEALEYEFDLDNFDRDDAKFVASGSLPEILGMPKTNSLSKDIRQALISKGIERVKYSVNGYWLVSRLDQVAK